MMKNVSFLWISVLLHVCTVNGIAPRPESSDADVAIIRNVVSSLPRTHPLYSSLLSPLSSYRLREMARWLGHYPNWQHYPHNYLLSIMNGHGGPTGYHHPPAYIRPQVMVGVKPSGHVGVKPPVQVEIKPLEFSSWYKLWKEEEVGECGIPDVEPTLKMLRVVGGNVAKPGNWPWMVSFYLQAAEQPWCAGILLSRQWILSAPHCVLMFPNISNWVPRLGKFSVSKGTPVFENGREQDFKIDKIVAHPDYKTHAVYKPNENKLYMVPDNDIALIKLDRPATFTKWVKPLCLPHNDEVPETGQKCSISGWGSTEDKGFPGVLNEAVVPVYSYDECIKFPGYKELVTKNNICAGFTAGKVDTCNGDSGGPLQCIFNNRWVVAGITSYGDAGERDCGRPLRPGVYTKTANFVEWIQQTIYQDYKDTFNQKQQP